ncbi:MAG: MoaD/ThiS family protein [Firmicutes bacterium]|nr:MoaD/ThiS family protein [Bacillota bacterium]MCL5039242.1 MoaD/ThiS family protein [Bacillota bacterium]
MGQIKVSIKYYNLLREAAGQAREEVTLTSPANLLDLLLHLEKQHGEGLGRWILNEGKEISPAVRIFLNGDTPGESQALQDGDEVALFMAISGGSAGVPLSTSY